MAITISGDTPNFSAATITTLTSTTGTITTLTSTTLSDGTNSTLTTNLVRAPCVAWVNFDGTLSSPITPRASYNVSSVTKSGTGYFLITFTNAISDTNYSAVVTCGNGDSTVNRNAQTGATYSTTQLSINTGDGAGTPVNTSVVTAAIFR